MRQQELVLLLGTNLGDREENIRRALEALDKAFGGRRVKLTKIIETEACGFNGPPFLNAVVVYRSARKPENVLKICKQIERSMGRTDAPEYAPDGSDILFYGEHSVSTPQLSIPHPQVHSRPFVKQLLEML